MTTYEQTLELAARWLEDKTGHEVDRPYVMLGDLCDAIDADATIDGDRVTVLVSVTSFEVPVRRIGKEKYVTLYDVSGGLCVALTGDDPGLYVEFMGEAKEARVRALRRAVLGDRKA